MTTAEVSWPVVLGQYWYCPWLREQAEVNSAEKQMRSTFRRPPDEDEIERAIRWLAGPANKKQEKCPTLRELIRAIAILRKEDREQNEAGDPSVGACAMCNKGWATCYPDWKEDWTPQDYAVGYCSSIPCACSAGGKLLVTLRDYQNMPPNEAETLTHRRNGVVSQWRHRRKQLAEGGLISQETEAYIAKAERTSMSMLEEYQEGGE